MKAAFREEAGEITKTFVGQVHTVLVEEVCILVEKIQLL